MFLVVLLAWIVVIAIGSALAESAWVLLLLVPVAVLGLALRWQPKERFEDELP